MDDDHMTEEGEDGDEGEEPIAPTISKEEAAERLLVSDGVIKYTCVCVCVCLWWCQVSVGKGCQGCVVVMNGVFCRCV